MNTQFGVNCFLRMVKLGLNRFLRMVEVGFLVQIYKVNAPGKCVRGEGKGREGNGRGGEGAFTLYLNRIFIKCCPTSVERMKILFRWLCADIIKKSYASTRLVTSRMKPIAFVCICRSSVTLEWVKHIPRFPLPLPFPLPYPSRLPFPYPYPFPRPF